VERKARRVVLWRKLGAKVSVEGDAVDASKGARKKKRKDSGNSVQRTLFTLGGNIASGGRGEGKFQGSKMRELPREIKKKSRNQRASEKKEGEGGHDRSGQEVHKGKKGARRGEGGERSPVVRGNPKKEPESEKGKRL